MARAWTKQHISHIEKHGKRGASWYCIWNEPDGGRRQKSFGAGPDGKRRAQMHADVLNNQFATEDYEGGKGKRTTWDEFLIEFKRLHLSKKRPGTTRAYIDSLNVFARILKLDGKPLSRVTSEAIARFTAKRLKDPGRKRKTTTSAANVNKDLRHVRAALRKAHKWGYLPAVPAIDFEKEPETAKRCVTPLHFTAMFKAADKMSDPGDRPAEFWKGLLALAYCTGWRIGEILSLEWSAIEWNDDGSGTVKLTAAGTKGNRHANVWLHPFVMENLTPLRTSLAEPLVFRWDKSLRRLQELFNGLQRAAGVDVECVEERKHECTDQCRLYSFHDLRRGFATVNAERMQRDALQKLMRHVSAATTARYIPFAAEMKPQAVDLLIPDVG